MEIQMGNILEGACAMAGYDLTLQTAPARWRQMAAMAVNEGLRRIHAEKFQAVRDIRDTFIQTLPSFMKGPVRLREAQDRSRRFLY